MASFVRASKYRHIFCAPDKNIFHDLRLGNATGDQQYIKCNGKYFAIAVGGGGGPFTVLPLDKPQRVSREQPVFNGHTGAVLDFDFHPFNDNIIASGSDDQTVKIWNIPEGGLTENISEPLVDLIGHGRRVTLLRFHPTAEGILASASKDNEIKIWDINTGSEIITNRECADLIQDLVWDYSGKHYATASKDKKVKMFDARTATETLCLNTPHEGSKSMKLSFLGDKEQLLTVGFTKQSDREFKIWDYRKLDKPLCRVGMDQAAGVILPFYDPDTSVLYLAGKGDGNVRYYEISSGDGTAVAHPISDYRSNVPAKGMAWMPKRNLDIMKCETAKLLKLTPTTMEPLSFTVPRKSHEFQMDLYPDTVAGTAAVSSAEWIAGTDKKPILMSLNPSAKPSIGSRPSTTPANFFKPIKTPLQLQSELDTANKRIVELEQKLKDAGIEF